MGEALSIESCVAAVKEVLDARCPGQKVLLVGYSLGASVAAAFLKEHPDRCSGVAVCGAGMDLASSTKGSVIGWLMRAMGSMLSAPTKRSFAAAQKSAGEVEEAAFDAYVLDLGLYFWKNTNETVTTLLGVDIRACVRDAPERLRSNAWLMVGSKDATDFVHEWPGGRAVVYEGMGHELPFSSNAAARALFEADLTALATQALASPSSEAST